jgi:hypothetical protein
VGGGLERAGLRAETAAGALLRRLTSDEAACCLVETPGPDNGDMRVASSARMAELFVSSEEFGAVVAQTGLAPMLFWPR